MTAPTEAPALAPHLETLFAAAAALVSMGAAHNPHYAIFKAAPSVELGEAACAAFDGLSHWPDEPVPPPAATLALLAAAAVCRGEPIALTLAGLPVPQLPASERAAYEDAAAVSL